MPYTLSHVAAVLPLALLLARLRILSAMVIGSMVPDFGYILPIHPLRAVTHSAVSLVTFSLPLGVWDGFTHEGARGMRMMPELDD
jgi:hypothetical protein